MIQEVCKKYKIANYNLVSLFQQYFTVSHAIIKTKKRGIILIIKI